MLLRWEIHDPPRAGKFSGFGDEHRSGVYLAGFASLCIQAEVALETLFEHQGNAFAHDADGVHCVDQRLDGRNLSVDVALHSDKLIVTLAPLDSGQPLVYNSYNSTYFVNNAVTLRVEIDHDWR